MWWCSVLPSSSVLLGCRMAPVEQPLPGRLRPDWRVNSGKESGRAITGGHTFDSRHD